MMISVQSYIRQGRHILRRWAVDPRLHRLLRGALWLLAGLFLSAASLGNRPQPLALGLVCASAGWPAALIALGAGAGYWLFWGQAGLQGTAWMAAGLLCALSLGERRISRDTPLLLPALAGLIVAASGVAFQIWAKDDTPVLMYLLRVALGAGVARLFALFFARRDAILDWLVCGIGVLALAQVVPLPYCGLGFLAAGAVGAVGALPAAALAGLALDLARVTPVPMTAVLCLAYLPRLLPRLPKWVARCGPAAVYIVVMGLCGVWDLAPVPGMLVGGLLSTLLPAQPKVAHRRGETGVAQVRLEMTAGVLSQAEQLLLEAPEDPVDEAALISKAAQRACGGCPCRKSCHEREKAANLPAQLLHRPLLSGEDLPLSCRKSGRLLAELHRSQEQLRAIRADRARQREYRTAVVQQYQFLAEYLQDLSDRLSQRGSGPVQRYQPQVAVYANRRESENGDRCLWFAGTECRYYVLLCDGMGTGLGAVEDGRTAGNMLRRLLSVGYPAEYALRSLNSLCALGNRAGAVTVDLAELQLDTGKAVLYKWGAAPSYLLTRAGAEKIGTAGPPPGLSVTEGRETADRLSLRRGETLVMVSDGVGGEEALRGCQETPGEPPGKLAARILECGNRDGTDDATVAVVRLSPAPVAT